jgi:hypothetical protein
MRDRSSVFAALGKIVDAAASYATGKPIPASAFASLLYSYSDGRAIRARLKYHIGARLVDPDKIPNFAFYRSPVNQLQALHRLGPNDMRAVDIVTALGALPHAGVVALNDGLLPETLSRFVPLFRRFIKDEHSSPKAVLKLGGSLAYLIRFAERALGAKTEPKLLGLIDQLRGEVRSATFKARALDLPAASGGGLSASQLKALVCRFEHQATSALFRIGRNPDETISIEEALSVGAFDLAIYVFLLTLMQAGLKGDFQSADDLSGHYLHEFEKRLEADPREIAVLYQEQDPIKLPDLNPRTCLASFCREMRGFSRRRVSYADELGLKLALWG